MDDNKAKWPMTDMEKILVIWKEEQISYNIPLNQSLNPEQSPNSFQFHEGCGG